MPLTFNRRPLTVNTPSSSDVKQYYINQNAFTGINESKNYLTVDQNSFSDCNNVYVDEFGLLRSRPSLKSDTQYTQHTYGNHAVYDFDTFVCFVGDNRLIIYVDGTRKFDHRAVGVSKDTPVILKDNHLFLFGSTFHVFDVTNLEYVVTKNIRNFLYPPNKSTDDDIGIDADNLLASGSKSSYVNRDEIYSNIDDGETVTVSVDGKTYSLIYDDYFFQRVFYKDYRVPSYYTKNWKNIAVTQKSNGSYVYAIYHEDVNDIHLIDNSADTADISLGKIVLGSHICIVFEGGLQFSDDGQYLIAITDVGYFRYKLFETGSNWELVFVYRAYRNRIDERTFYESSNYSVFGCDFAGCHFLTGTDYLLQYKLTYGQFEGDKNDNVQSCLVRVLRTTDEYINLHGTGTHSSGYFSWADDLSPAGSDNVFVLAEEYDEPVDTGDFFVCSCHLELGGNYLQFVTSYDYNDGNITSRLLYSYSIGKNMNAGNSLLSPDVYNLGYHCDKFNLSFITTGDGIFGSAVISSETFHYYLGTIVEGLKTYGTGQNNIILYTPDTYVTNDKISFGNKVYDSDLAGELPFNNFYPLHVGHDIVLYKDGYIYNNIYGTSELVVSITDTLTPNPNNLHFTDYALLQQYYFVDGSKVYITDNRYDEQGVIQWYVHDYQDFGEEIVNIHKISTTEVAIFTPTSIWYITYDGENGVYRYTKSVIPLGIIRNSDVVTSFDGTRIIFPTTEGLAALTYQDFVATTEQALTFLTDNVKSLYKDFSTSGLRLCQYSYWLICYNPDSNICMLYDYRNSGWWKWTFWDNVKNVFVIGNLLKFDISTEFYDIDKSNENYYDADDNHITWSIKSQPMHLGSPNNYKHISNLLLDTVIDATQYDNCTYELKVYNYRDVIRDAEPEVVVYNVDGFKAFNKRLNYPKVVNFQYELNNIDNLSHNIPLSLANVSIKYGVKGEVR